MFILHVDTHTNHITVFKGIDRYRKYVRIISTISTYKMNTVIDVILTTVDTISEYILIYRSRIVENRNISIDVIFLTFLIDDTDLIFELILSCRSDDGVWYVWDLIFQFILSLTFH